MPETPEVVRINSEYYDNLYQHRNSWIFRLRGLISFDQQSKAKPNYRAARTLLAGVRRRPRRILDYGCGWGSFLLKWSGKEEQLFCYDISNAAMDQVVSAGIAKGVTITKADDAGKMPCGEFDLILCSHVMEHVPADDILFSQLADRLRPGGFLLVNVPVNEVWKDPKHIRTYGVERVQELFQESGLRVLMYNEFDRWTAFFLTHEVVRDHSRLTRASLRGLRAVMAVTPLVFQQSLEWLLGKEYAPQQLLMAGQKQ